MGYVPPGTQGTWPAGEMWVHQEHHSPSRAAFLKALNLHCYCGSGLVLPQHRSPSRVGCSPRSRHSRDAKPLPGDCPEAATCQNWQACTSKNQGLEPPSRFGTSGKIWGHGAAAPGQHTACTLLHPAADRDWCVPSMVPHSLAQNHDPQPAHAADPSQGLSCLPGQSQVAPQGCTPCPAPSHHGNSHP